LDLADLSLADAGLRLRC
jgi:alpha-glucosidase